MSKKADIIAKPKIVIIDDGSLSSKVFQAEYGDKYDFVKVKDIAEAKKTGLTIMTHYTNEEITPIRHKLPKGCINRYENHSKQGIEALAKKYGVKIPLAKTPEDDTI